jgi:hypothetical protein
MKSLLIIAALLIPLGSASALLAGQPYEALDAGDVFVATITRVEDKDATNARPPRVWLKVHEVLRGDAKLARSPGLWSPPFHGIDWGDGSQPELKRWNAAPLKGPKVGQKFILGGSALKPAADGKDAPVYYLFAFVRIPYSDKARTETIASLKALEAARSRYAAERAAAAKERELRVKKWRAAIDDEIIDKRTQQADAVAIAQIVSGGTYEVETLLKGQPRMSSGGKYYVTLPDKGYDERIADLVAERPRCIFFLSEKQLVASVSDIHAELVDPFEGIVLADDAAIAAVQASLKKRPPPKPTPVLVISALDRAAAAPLGQAAQASFTVIHSHQFSSHGPDTVSHVRKTLPHASVLVMIDRGPQSHVAAVEITLDDATTVYEATWPEKDADQEVEALMKKLAERE